MLSDQDKRNAIWNSLSFIISQFLGFINYSLNVKTFGFEIYGYFILLSAIFGIGSNLDLGFGVSTIKYISESLKKKDIKQVNVIFNSFFLVYIVLGLIITIFYIVYFHFFSRISIISDIDSTSNTEYIYFILIFAFFFNYISSFLRSVYEGLSEYILVNKLTLFVSLFTTSMMFVIFIFKLTLIHLAFAFLLNSVVSSIILYLFLYYKATSLKLFREDINLSLLRKVVKYSINLQVAFLIGNSLDLIIKYLLGIFLGYRVVTIFETGKKIINLSSGIYLAGQRGLLNKLSERNVLGDLNIFVNTGMKYYSKIANQFSLMLYGVLNPIICIFIIKWFDNYEAIIVFLILSLSYSLINFGVPLYSTLMIEGRGFRLTIIQLTNVLLTSILLFISIKLIDNYLGLLGYFVSTIISIIFMNYFLKKTYKFDFLNYIRHIYSTSVVLLIFLSIIELLTLFYFSEFYLMILLIFFILYSIFYYNHILYFYKFFRVKIFEVFNFH